MNVNALLTDPARRWNAEPGASESDLRRLQSVSPIRLPDELLDLLHFSNGGEGDLALPPLLFMLDPVEAIIEGISDSFLLKEFPGFLFIGGNGGLERIAFDTRHGSPPWPIVMIDPIAGLNSTYTIAPDFATFVQAIGLELPEESEDNDICA